MILRKSFPVTFTAPPKGSFDRLFCGRISIACWRKWASQNCVLDAGGGEGQTAIKMAERGHQVILCDLSAQMIDRAQNRRQKQRCERQHAIIHCAAQDVASHLETPVDLILFHAVLEWVADPQAYYRPCGQCCVQRRVVVNVLQCAWFVDA